MKKIISLFMAITLVVLSFNTMVFASNAPSNNEDYPYVYDLRWDNQTARWSKYGKVQNFEVMLCTEGKIGDVYTTSSTYYNFGGKMIEGDHAYFFKVRAYNKNTGWSVWEQSPTVNFTKNKNKIQRNTDTTPGAGGAIYNGNTDVQELFSNPPGVWEKVNGLWFFQLVNGVYATNMWINSNGLWYYVNQYGTMVVGLAEIGGKYYYFNESGVMQVGEVKIGTKKHVFGFDGAMIK